MITQSNRSKERQPNERTLEMVAYECFLAQLANPNVRDKQNDMSVIASRSFAAAIAFREEAAKVRKLYSEGESK